jgi:hypothetical protein
MNRATRLGSLYPLSWAMAVKPWEHSFVHLNGKCLELALLDEPIMVRGTAVFHVPLLSTLTLIMWILNEATQMPRRS